MHLFLNTESHGLKASVQTSRFTCQNGLEEVHLVVRPAGPGTPDQQLAAMERAGQVALAAMGLPAESAVFRRFYCSNLGEQREALMQNAWSRTDAPEAPCAVSWIEQPPLPPADFVLWAHHIHDPSGATLKRMEGCTCVVERDGYTHLWTAGLASPHAGSTYAQTEDVFSKYIGLLARHEMQLATDCMRTWLYVHNIDWHYSEMTEARKKLFMQHGLTPQTHYIASTGIEGRGPITGGTVVLDAYAVSNLRQDQIRHLEALGNLGPTDAYGVTFERGTAIRFEDRTAITISGTASINPQGEIVHPENLPGQLERTLANIEALLAEAGASMEAVQVFTVYLRHTKDRAYALQEMRRRFGMMPMVVVTAPVCRSGWLIEIEAEAMLLQANT